MMVNGEGGNKAHTEYGILDLLPVCSNILDRSCWPNSHQNPENNSELLAKGKCRPFLAPIPGSTSVTNRGTTLTSQDDNCYLIHIGLGPNTVNK
eukprot:4874945-Ditylum_brightwellii.AAC.1